MVPHSMGSSMVVHRGESKEREACSEKQQGGHVSCERDTCCYITSPIVIAREHRRTAEPSMVLLDDRRAAAWGALIAYHLTPRKDLLS